MGRSKFLAREKENPFDEDDAEDSSSGVADRKTGKAAATDWANVSLESPH